MVRPRDTQESKNGPWQCEHSCAEERYSRTSLGSGTAMGIFCRIMWRAASSLRLRAFEARDCDTIGTRGHSVTDRVWMSFKVENSAGSNWTGLLDNFKWRRPFNFPISCGSSWIWLCSKFSVASFVRRPIERERPWSLLCETSSSFRPTSWKISSGIHVSWFLESDKMVSLCKCPISVGISWRALQHLSGRVRKSYYGVGFWRPYSNKESAERNLRSSGVSWVIFIEQSIRLDDRLISESRSGAVCVSSSWQWARTGDRSLNFKDMWSIKSLNNAILCSLLRMLLYVKKGNLIRISSFKSLLFLALREGQSRRVCCVLCLLNAGLVCISSSRPLSPGWLCGKKSRNEWRRQTLCTVRVEQML